MDAASSPRVLVTGATGFLGAYVCPALRRAGWTVRAAVRDPRGSPQAQETALVRGLDDPAGWDDALDGAEAVVHLAGLAHQRWSAEDHVRVNRDGAAMLARLAAGRVRTFVHLSTALVHGSSSEGRPPFREDDALRPQSAYAASKAQAEDLLAAIAATSGLALTILRPPLIYGRNAKSNFALLARLLGAGMPLPLASIGNRRDFVAAENVADAIGHVLRDRQDGTRTFLVADGEPVSTPEFARRMADAMGRPGRLFGVPPALLGQALRCTGKGRLRDSLLASLECDITRIRRAGWEPPTTMRAALRHIFAAEGSSPAGH